MKDTIYVQIRIAVTYKLEGEYCGISVNNCESGFSCVEPEYDNDVGTCVKNGKIRVFRASREYIYIWQIYKYTYLSFFQIL